MNKDFWNSKWKNAQTKWDIGYPSPTIIEFCNKIKNKSIAILIPGCGNAYEAEYLLENGFNNITLIDIAPFAVDILKSKFQNISSIKILCEDFFDHNESYDLIIEQTFFCALPISKRQKYVEKIYQLLKPNALLIGVLFNKHFKDSFPPFGGSKEEYNALFSPYFKINKLEQCYNSIQPRMGNEFFIKLTKE